MSDKLNTILNDYYNEYVEDERLIKDKMHHIEFITTIHYIDKYLKKDDRILEVGAGTGRYSLYYAKQGYQVDAIELIPKNIETFKSHIKDNMNIKINQGNATDLSMYDDNTFDITLVLGPLYHLFDKEMQKKAIEEAIRVTKKEGIIYIAFILFDSSLVAYGFGNYELIDNIGINKRITDNYTPNNMEENIFYFMYFNEVKELINNFSIDILNYASTDGISNIIKDKINNMNDEMYKHYVNYHLSTCEREDLIGYSGHILSIIKK